MRTIFLKFLPYILLPIAISSVQPYTSLPVGNTIIWWVIQVFILISFWIAKRLFYDESQNRLMLFVHIYLLYNCCSLFYGITMAEMYWDWKSLVNNMMSLLLPIFVYVATNISLVQKLLNKFLWVVVPIFFLYLPFIYYDSYGEYLAPMSFLIFFIPVLNNRHRAIVLLFLVFVVASNVGSRSNTIKFIVPLLLLVIYYLRAINLRAILEVARLLLMVLPIVLFSLAIAGIFNPFEISSYVEGDFVQEKVEGDGKLRKEDLTADTRTGLYIEVLASAKKHNTWIFGRSPARGNDTKLFADYMENITGRKERFTNEVSILNIFTWTGIVGVIIYFLLFWRATYIAINRSNNIFAKMLGIYVAFRWTYAWVEEFNIFNMHYLTLWMAVGLCISNSFRSLSNEDVKIWARAIFDKKYFRVYQKYVLSHLK